jgi:hypothetical protein
MAETTMHLTTEEQAFLLELLERTLKDTRVEEHRTRSPNYREFVLKEKRTIMRLIEKLEPTPT